MPAGDRVRLIPAPHDAPRVETGAVQIGDDFPGLFVRGDNAIVLAIRLRRLAGLLATHPDPDVADVLGSVMRYAELIEQDVSVRSAD